VERAVEGGVRVEQPRCPYCHDTIATGTPQLACNSCRAWHHQDCWGEAGKRCAACGSDATGFLAADAPVAAGEPTQRRDPEREFRFACPHCKEAMWAPKAAVGRTGVCPGCKRETRVPEVGAPRGIKGSWQSELNDTLFTITIIALLFGGLAWAAGALGSLLANVDPAAWFCRAFAVIYLVGVAGTTLGGEGTGHPRYPRKRIAFAGLLSLLGFLCAWLAGAERWALASLLPPWPLFVLGLFSDSSPEPPPPVPGKAPWQGE